MCEWVSLSNILIGLLYKIYVNITQCQGSLQKVYSLTFFFTGPPPMIPAVMPMGHPHVSVYQPHLDWKNFMDIIFPINNYKLPVTLFGMYYSLHCNNTFKNQSLTTECSNVHGTVIFLCE